MSSTTPTEMHANKSQTTRLTKLVEFCQFLSCQDPVEDFLATVLG